jgi:hypothetical protein
MRILRIQIRFRIRIPNTLTLTSGITLHGIQFRTHTQTFNSGNKFTLGSEVEISAGRVFIVCSEY